VDKRILFIEVPGNKMLEKYKIIIKVFGKMYKYQTNTKDKFILDKKTTLTVTFSSNNIYVSFLYPNFLGKIQLDHHICPLFHLGFFLQKYVIIL
jgi:hypothetical protein